MKLIIDIDEDMYKSACKNDDVYVLDDADCILIENAIANGTPLTEIIESIKDKILDNYDNSKGDGVREECLDIIDNAIYGGRHYTCSDCILDLTDACSRGAGRAVDDEICEDFLTDKGEQEGEVQQ